jgi:hypothetical protein
MSSPTEPSTRPAFCPRLRLILTGLVLCRGLVYLCVIPPFEGWDEYQHVGYVVHVQETGRPAILGETDVPRSLLRAAVRLPHPKGVVAEQIGWIGAVDYATFWARHDPRRSRPIEPVPWLDAVHLRLYQAQHSWWYYRFVTPLFRALGGVGDLRRSIGGLRLLNLGFTAAAVWVALRAIGRLVPDPRHAALIGLVIAVQPLFVVNGVRVANDALGALLATVAVVGCLRLGHRRPVAWWSGIGVVIGLAILAKATNLSLVPFAGFCWLVVAIRERLSAGRTVAAGLALAVGCLAVVQSDLRSNLATFGTPMPMQEAVINRSLGRTASDLLAAAARVRWSTHLIWLWSYNTFAGGGWSGQGPTSLTRSVYTYALLAGLLGWAWCVPGRPGRRAAVFGSWQVPAACVVLCLSFTAALAYHAVQSKLAWGHTTTCPWYACPALPWFLAVAVGGGLAWPLGRFRPAVPIVLTAACLAGEASALWGRMVPTYSGGGAGLEALRRLAFLQPPWLGTATLFAALAGELVFLTAAAVAMFRGRGPAPAPGVLRGPRLARSDRRPGMRAAAPSPTLPSP